jgi:ADP-heptose:LPS heptosyltransferase
MTYQRILMVKSHSMGVGDVLRSSAAWRVLKDKWPQAELHLLFLSKHAGYPDRRLYPTAPFARKRYFSDDT